MSEARKHYVYAHRRESDGTVFYYGKGKDRRAWSSCGRNQYWHNIAKKHGWSVKIVKSEMPEPCALALERLLICRDRGNKLANLTDGGGGVPGWRHSEETKRRIGAHWKGREFTPKMREALALANKNRRLTDAQRANMSAASKRRVRTPHTPETRAKIAASHIGLKPTAEARRNMSLAKIGKCVGRDSPTYDHTIRHFAHADGSEFIGTRGDFILKFGLPDGCVSAAISGRQKSVKGWKLK